MPVKFVNYCLALITLRVMSINWVLLNSISALHTMAHTVYFIIFLKYYCLYNVILLISSQGNKTALLLQSLQIKQLIYDVLINYLNLFIKQYKTIHRSLFHKENCYIKRF